MTEFTMDRLRENLESLKMKNTLEILDNYLERAVTENLNIVDVLDHIFAEEAKSRRKRAYEKQIQMSGFPIKKTLDPRSLWSGIHLFGKMGTIYFTERKGPTYMGNNTYGYARVSTQKQNETRQLAAMREFGVEEQNIVVEKLSGKDFQRPRYQRLVRSLKPGDVLVVKSIDRLGRNYNEILEQWGVITKKRKAAIVVLDMPLLDTRQGRDLTGMLIADIVLQLLSYVAQTERENIRQRQAEGIVAAKAKGVRFGRKRRTLPDNFEELRQARRRKEITLMAAAKLCGISQTTFYDTAVRVEAACEGPK